MVGSNTERRAGARAWAGAMNGGVIAGAVCAAALLVPAGAPLAAQGPARIDAAELAAFGDYVEQAMREWNVPGLAIALVKDDSLLLARGYGVIEVGEPGPIDEHTRFAVGSTTKAMTTAALAMLVDEGKLSWDDRVIDHLPAFRLQDPYATRELTVRDLLTHRTGLPGTDLFWVRLDYSMPEMMRALRYIEPSSSFRSQWNYQNVVYALAGELVEKASGMSWEQFVRTRLFQPLGMNETEPLDAGILQKPNVAQPHDAEGDSIFTVPKRSTDSVASVGSVWSSVSDMSKWMRFMLDSARVGSTALIQPETFREIVTPEIRADIATYPALEVVKPHIFTYALGWFVQDYAGDVVWMHTGSINGMSAILGLLPDRRFGVVVLINKDHAELRHALMYRAFDLAAGNSPRDWSTELLAHFTHEPRTAAAPDAESTPPSLPLDRYAGTYSSPAYGDVQVSLVDDVLRVSIADGPAQALVHRNYEMFRTAPAGPDGNELSVTFVPDGAGRVASLRLFGITFERERERGS